VLAAAAAPPWAWSGESMTEIHSVDQ
jgi:hypothetical protein